MVVSTVGVAAGRRAIDVPAAARPPVYRRPGWLVAAGTVGAVGYLLAEARISQHGRVVPLWDWGGLTHRLGSGPARGLAALFGIVGLAVFLYSWWGLYRAAQRDGLRRRLLAGAAVGWVGPFLVGPPLLSLDIYAYIAQGQLVARGLDAYRVGPAVLHSGPVLAAVDPLWRHVPAPYGPLQLAVQALAVKVAGPHPVLAVFLLRATVAVALVLVGVLVARLLAPGQRAAAVVLVLLNPVTLVYLVSGAHLDALMGLFVVLALVAARAGRLRWALAAAAVATSFKAPAAVAVLALLVLDLYPRRGLDRLRRAGGDLLVSGGVLVLSSLAVPDGFGWLGTMATPARVTAGYAPAEILAHAVRGLLAVGGAHPHWRTVLAVVRVLVLVVSAVLLVLLARAVPRRGALEVTTLGLVVVAAAAPVFYGWYLSWPLLPAALLTMRRHVRRLVVAGTAFGVVGLLPDVHLLTPNERHVCVAVLLVAALAALVVFARRHGPVTLDRPLPLSWPARLRTESGLVGFATSAVVAAFAVAALAGPATGLPGPVRHTAAKLATDAPIRLSWEYDRHTYVLLVQAPTDPRLVGHAPLALLALVVGADGKPLPMCDLNASGRLLPSVEHTPVRLYQAAAGQRCWRLVEQRVGVPSVCAETEPATPTARPLTDCRPVPVRPFTPELSL